MVGRSWMRLLDSLSDNRKSKIPNSQMGGGFCTRRRAHALRAASTGAAAGENSLHRYLVPSSRSARPHYSLQGTSALTDC